jgi:hypothetical protein
MKNLCKIFVSSLIVIGFLCLNGNAEDLKKGTTSGIFPFSGTFTYLAMGKERAHMSYEMYGSMIPDPGNTLFKNSSVHCLGALHAINGHFDDDKGACVYTDPDDDQFFITYQDKGDIGQGAKGNYEYVGGTGKYAGLKGSGEYTIVELKPAKEGTFQSISTYKGNWELP